MADPVTGTAAASPAVLDEIARQLRGLDFGQVQVTVHDARVVEICTTTRKRLKP